MITLTVAQLSWGLALVIFSCLALGFAMGKTDAKDFEDSSQSKKDSEPTPQSRQMTVGELKHKLECVKDNTPLSFSLVCLSPADIGTVRRNSCIVCAPDDEDEIVLEII